MRERLKGVFGSNPDNLTGLRFGKLTALRIAERSQSGNMIWWCQCDCGGPESKHWQGTLRKGAVKSCGCIAKSRMRRIGRSWKREGSAFRYLLRRYKQNAKRKSRVFELSEEQFRTLTSSDCYYCGNPPEQESISCGGNRYDHNGIDRIDSDEGYYYENCVPCCSVCNRMKMALPQDIFISQVCKIARRLS